MLSVTDCHIIQFTEMFSDCVCPANQPSCVDLLHMPARVLKNKDLWPSSLCHDVFLLSSTKRWFDETALLGGWEAQLESAHSFELELLSDMWPLPVGKQALNRRVSIFNGNVGAYMSARRLAVFDGLEEAMWVLRVKVSGNTLDLFGLAEDTSGVSVDRDDLSVYPGKLKYVLKGTDTSLLDIVRAADRWWSTFRGQPVQGRPAGSGTWEDVEQLKEAIRTAVRALHKQGRAATQQEVAAYFCDHTGLPRCDARQLRRWLTRYDLNWQEISALL